MSRIRHYAHILNPLFWSDDFNHVDRMFEWACTMVRVTGTKDTGWDCYIESIALLEDPPQLMSLELPKDRFPNPANKQARLALIASSHMVEMSVPYGLLTNLLRLRMGMKYSVEPLSLESVKVHVVKGKRVKAANPLKKIIEIQKMASKAEAGVPDVGTALRRIYNGTICRLR